MDEDISKFNKKLDTWVNEKVDVDRIVYDQETNKLEVKTVQENRKVKYLHAPKKKHRCKQGEHIFRVLNRSKYIFGCTKCQFSRMVFPGVYKLTPEGHLIHRETNTRV